LERPRYASLGDLAIDPLVIWELWKERNASIFQRRHLSPESLIAKIEEEVITWSLAGAKATEANQQIILNYGVA